MSNHLRLKIGDLVVRYGKVLKVSQLNKDTISLQPLSKLQSSNGLTFTIKFDSPQEGHLRRLISKDKLKQLMNQIIKKPITKEDCPVYDSNSALNSNRLADSLWVIKTLFLEKQEKSNTLPGGKLTIFQKALIQITEEVAAVTNTTIEKAKTQLLSALKISTDSSLKNS